MTVLASMAAVCFYHIVPLQDSPRFYDTSRLYDNDIVRLYV